MIRSLFSEGEMYDFFTRPTFTGSAVRVSQLFVRGWIVLMGDSAHAVYPATGEGINSALDDAHVLQSVLQDDTARPCIESLRRGLKAYETVRLEDSQALSEYAFTLLRPTLIDRIKKILFGLFGRFLTKSKILGTDPVQSLFFGPSTTDQLHSYSFIMNEWDKQYSLLGGRPRMGDALVDTKETNTTYKMD
jgi:flavin-dependent dehydrogenase